MTATPITTPRAKTSARVRKPLKADKKPPRGRRMRGGGGGAATGFSASLGLFGASLSIVANAGRFSGLRCPQHQGCIGAAKAKRIGQDNLDRPCFRLVRQE